MHACDAMRAKYIPVLMMMRAFCKQNVNQNTHFRKCPSLPFFLFFSSPFNFIEYNIFVSVYQAMMRLELPINFANCLCVRRRSADKKSSKEPTIKQKSHITLPTMSNGAGIQELMAAETRASQIVAEARIGEF